MSSSVSMRRHVLTIILVATGAACVGCDSTSADTRTAPTVGVTEDPVTSSNPEPREPTTALTGSADPTPMISNGTSTVGATLSVCGPACDGPAMLGERPNVLMADGHSEIVVRVASPYTVAARWGTGEFQRIDDQTLVAPPPPPGCHPAGLTVTGVDEYDWTYEIVILGDSSSTCG